MSKELRILLRVAVVGALFLGVTTLIPALLSCNSDLGVLVGVFSFIGLVVIGWTKNKPILDWFKNI